MSDREKVIGHLYDCLAASKPENLWVFVRKDIVGDALNLLKEQEAVKPLKSKLSFTHGFDWEIWDCGCCGNQLRSFAKYCDQCGKAVQWDET